MMRSLLTAVLCAALLQPLSAQKNVEIGMSTGMVHYYGDLGNWDGPMQWNSARPGMAISARNFFGNPKRYVTRALDMETRFTWHRIGYDETEPTGGLEGTELHNFRRGLNFRTDLFGLSTHLVLNAYREPYQPLFKQRFFAYFFVGIGVFYGRPKGDLFRGGASLDNAYYYWDDGTIRDRAEDPQNPNQHANIVEHDGTYETDLYSWHTEGGWGRGENASPETTTPWHIGFPWGFGIRYMVTRQFSVGAEFAYYSFLTDKLDDVSDRYATYEEIGAAFPNDSTQQFLARYVSDPTGWGSIGTIDERTSQRGNPGLPDYYSYLSFEVSYRMGKGNSPRLMLSKRVE